MKTKYLIVGNSAGGISAVEAIRRIDRRGRIVLVSDEPYPAYSRPMIAKYLTGERTLDGMLYRPADFYDNNDIDALLGSRVVRIHSGNRIAEMGNGEEISWQRLLLATGGAPVVPEGIDLDIKGVHTFATLDDARAIGEIIDAGCSRAAVIGGGLIGLSAAEALRKRGVAVTIVEMKHRILSTALDERGSALAAAAAASHGVDMLVGRTVTGIIGKDRASGVVLDDGTRLAADAVIVAIGVSPRTELAQGAGISTNRGVPVNRRMMTAARNVYCCGDAAEAYDLVDGDSRVIPIWPLAYIGGRVAGCNMAGVRTEYPGGASMNVIRYFGTEIAAAGLTHADGGAGYEVLSREGGGIYRKVILNEGRICGMVFAGSIERCGIAYSLMAQRIDVSRFKEALLADDFGLVHLPERIVEERLGAPPATEKATATA